MKAVLYFETGLGFSPRNGCRKNFTLFTASIIMLDNATGLYRIMIVFASHQVITGESFFELKCAQNETNCYTIQRCLLRWLFSVELDGAQAFYNSRLRFLFVMEIRVFLRW
jgi:hypothetical protein